MSVVPDVFKASSSLKFLSSFFSHREKVCCRGFAHIYFWPLLIYMCVSRTCFFIFQQSHSKICRIHCFLDFSSGLFLPRPVFFSLRCSSLNSSAAFTNTMWSTSLSMPVPPVFFSPFSHLFWLQSLFRLVATPIFRCGVAVPAAVNSFHVLK